MICFDTNTVIYIANEIISGDGFGDELILYPSIVKIESLGYTNIRSVEEQRIRELLATLTEVPLTSSVIELAITLRQNKKMSLGDSIVAATALENDMQLWTANIEDFQHIDGLKLVNPLLL
jgi:predicted nucleic acid-binding protein